MNVSNTNDYINENKRQDPTSKWRLERVVISVKTAKRWTNSLRSVVDVCISTIGLEEYLQHEVLQFWRKENKYLTLHHHLKLLSTKFLNDTSTLYLPFCFATHDKFEDTERRARKFYMKLELGLQTKKALWAGRVIFDKLGEHERINIHMDEKDPEKAIRELQGTKRMVDELKIDFEKLKEEWDAIKGELNSDLDRCIENVYLLLHVISGHEY
ncbi:unnamed protein product [Orchesella dallaii]|uniref:Uncharacterized protein n=1 Tax=Orchesella dallaii TaxID=48710 RepID=A0ABP1QQE2_9HEXA